MVDVFRPLLPQPAGVRSAEVDLEIRSVEIDPDVHDILGGAVEVVDEDLLKPLTWRWSRQLAGWYLPASRDTAARTAVITDTAREAPAPQGTK